MWPTMAEFATDFPKQAAELVGVIYVLGANAAVDRPKDRKVLQKEVWALYNFGFFKFDVNRISFFLWNDIIVKMSKHSFCRDAYRTYTISVNTDLMRQMWYWQVPSIPSWQAVNSDINAPAISVPVLCFNTHSIQWNVQIWNFGEAEHQISTWCQQIPWYLRY